MSLESAVVNNTGAYVAAKCSECTGTAGIDQKLLINYKVAVCTSCRHAREEKYKLMSKTNAKEKYLLTDHQLSKLPHMKVSNPRKIGWNDMQLYLALHLRERCFARWGDEVGLEKERARRKVESDKRRRIRAKKRAAEEGIEEGNLIMDRAIQGLRSDAGIGDGNCEDSAGDSDKAKQAEQVRKQRKLERRIARLKQTIGANRYHQHKFGAEKKSAPKVTNGIRTVIITRTCKSCGYTLREEEV